MPARNGLLIPKTQARSRWAVSIKAGLDIESTLGLPNQVTNLATMATQGQVLPSLGGSSGIGGLIDVGTIEQLDLGQAKEVTQRTGFNADPTQPFQTVPHGSSLTLKLTRVVLKNLQAAEALFEFFPSNLLFQQLPFIIEIADVGDETQQNAVRHYIFGCWFVGRSVKYDVTSADARLIEVAEIKPGRVLTLDPSVAGGALIQSASSLVGSLQGLAALAASNSAAAPVIQALNLS